jgi:hypothetical protein
MNCPYCQNTNPEQNRFCGYCGKQLLPISDTHPDVSFESASQTLVEQAVHDFEKKLYSVQMDALEHFQGQIRHLIKLLLWPFLIIFTSVVSVLAFMGYHEWKDFKGNIYRCQRSYPDCQSFYQG